MRYFEVRLSHPVKRDNPISSPVWQKNENLFIAAATAQRAIELALERFPEGTIHVVQTRGDALLIVDDSPISEEEEK